MITMNPPSSLPTSSPSAAIPLKVGQRIIYSGRTCTIKYLGPLPETQGLWLGVEWDDGNGKHNGSYKNELLFTTNLPTSGSFIRYLPEKIETGQLFLDSVMHRYGERAPVKPQEDKMIETIELSGTKLDIELIGFHKIAQKQR
jgi:dynactin complex subunit